MRYLPKTDSKVVYERTVPRGPAALHTLRHEVGERLESEGVEAKRVEDALLVVSELGTNAMHAAPYGEEIAVRVAVDKAGDVDIEVEDPGAGFRLSEGLRLPSRDEEHGRGLSIVCLLADETTVRRHRRHTVVRARILAKKSA